MNLNSSSQCLELILAHVLPSGKIKYFLLKNRALQLAFEELKSMATRKSIDKVLSYLSELCSLPFFSRKLFLAFMLNLGLP